MPPAGPRTALSISSRTRAAGTGTDGEWLDVTVWCGTDCGQVLQPEAPAARAGFFRQLDELLGEECGVLVDGDLA
ncbi:MAG TPA: hypothetical protein VF060_17825 [Trebonia sp.]